MGLPMPILCDMNDGNDILQQLNGVPLSNLRRLPEVGQVGPHTSQYYGQSDVRNSHEFVIL